MHANKPAFSSLQALYRIFVLPALSNPASRRPLRTRLQPATSSGPWPARPFSNTTYQQATARGPEERTQRWNEEITARYVQLIDPETNRPVPPQTRFDVLRRIDFKTHRLVQLTPDPPPDSPDAHDFIPICKVINKKEAYEQEKKKKAQMKEAKKASKLGSDVGGKTMELNWAIDSNNDLVHRMQKLKEFLEEGRKVEVVLAAKKRGRKASREECENVLKVIESTVDGVEGARTKEEMQGKLGGFTTMVFQGKVVKSSGTVGKENERIQEEVPVNVEEEDGSKRRKMRRRFDTKEEKGLEERDAA